MALTPYYINNIDFINLIVNNLDIINDFYIQHYIQDKSLTQFIVKRINPILMSLSYEIKDPALYSIYILDSELVVSNGIRKITLSYFCKQ